MIAIIEQIKDIIDEMRRELKNPSRFYNKLEVYEMQIRIETLVGVLELFEDHTLDAKSTLQILEKFQLN